MADAVALVTGVSSGIGQATATLLATRGFRVFGTVRTDRPGERGPGVELLQLDVTDSAQVQAVVDEVLRRAGGIDLLVNNAGYSLIGALEETSLAEARAQFDANFFGALRLIRAVLPAMRARRRGRIVNVSSALGFLPAPYMGIYAATKHALEACTETLDHEVRGFGIRAALVEPSFVKTRIGANSRMAGEALADYADDRRRVSAVIARRVASGPEPRVVADAVLRAATAPVPRLRYPVGEGVLLSRLRRFVPARLFDASFRQQFDLDPKAGRR